jgi:hypothetical protein
MSKSNKKQKDIHEEDVEQVDLEEYTEMELLERLESLLEDMEELGVKTIEEVRRRIAALHKQLDEKY